MGALYTGKFGGIIGVDDGQCKSDLIGGKTLCVVYISNEVFWLRPTILGSTPALTSYIHKYLSTERYQLRTKKKYKSSLITSLHSTLRPHNPPPKELTNNPEPVLRPLKLALEQIMLISRFHLSLTNSLDGGILWRADGTFSVFVDLV